MALRRAVDALAVGLWRPPTVDELAAELRISREEVVKAYQARDARMIASLDRPADGPDGESVAMGELLGGDDPGIARVTDRTWPAGRSEASPRVSAASSPCASAGT